MLLKSKIIWTRIGPAQSAGAEEYADYNSADDTKTPDEKISGMKL